MEIISLFARGLAQGLRHGFYVEMHLLSKSSKAFGNHVPKRVDIIMKAIQWLC